MPAPRRRSITAFRPQLAAGAVVLLVVIVAVVLLSSSGSTARRQQPVFQSLFQDDNHLVYAPAATVAKTLDTLAGLGVDRLRITVLWAAVAPGNSSPVPPPHFNGADPAAYAPGAWAPYDRIVTMAAARHMAVDFNITAPGPLWAMRRPAPSARLASHYEPSAADFGAFVAAVGRRYSGSYVPAGRQGGPLPRVDYWSIWNEPNQPGWLAPQWRAGAMDSPRLYRSYVDAAFGALQKTGHLPSSDTILIGELAPEGTEGASDEAPIPPLPFLRALYCLDSSYRPLQGAQAAALRCPVRPGSPAAFAAGHPGLFEATGFAHHPYSFFLPPTTPMSDPNFAPLSGLSRLEHALDASFAAYGVHRRLPIYLTEYGYETNPPNPFRGVSPQKQALYLNEAQYLAWADPRVRALAQFLLYDSPPDTRYPKGSIGYWSTFQTGLAFAGGAAKPSLAAYRLPLLIPQPVFAHGQKIYIWGMLRPASRDGVEQARIEWRSSTGSYRTVATVDVTNASGFFATNTALPGTGVVRIAWVSPAGATLYSREVGVNARP